MSHDNEEGAGLALESGVPTRAFRDWVSVDRGLGGVVARHSGHRHSVDCSGPMSTHILPGKPHPLGATVVGDGVNFALYSGHGESAEVCLYETARDAAPSMVVPFVGRTDGVFHCWVSGIGAGQVYGCRVAGPWKPGQGHRFDPTKVLLDPYVRAIARAVRWGPESYSYRAPSHPAPQVVDQALNGLCNAATCPLGMVAAPSPKEFEHPRRPWAETVVYELHVRGFTKRHPAVPPELRGTYAGLASEPIVEYIAGLGVTAVELLPVQHHVDDHRLQRMGLRNYWGYQPIGMFAPEPSYSSEQGVGAVEEFRAMVRRFHAAGIEVILDVVFNHTAELGHDGPTLSFRGIDNRSYYRLADKDRRRYRNYSGCGNSLNTANPAVSRLVMDCLRHWVSVMGVDGFRFDLAASLGRHRDRFDPTAPLLEAIRQDPVLKSAKLIAEPWDLHPSDGYHLGGFPPGWAEWNGRYRDVTRRFWRGDVGCTGAFTTGLAGSSDIFGRTRRSPLASVNFVTSHDGFTLADLVSYRSKRNDANGEGGRDGESNNHSWNCGQEGPSANSLLLALRKRQCRNLLATLLLSQGVPMLLAGDESGRTQIGNNNAYCQDNEISWLDWGPGYDSSMASFVRQLIRLRSGEPALRRSCFFEGSIDPGTGLKDVTWLSRAGHELSGAAWQTPEARCFGARIAEPGRPVYLLLFNSSERARTFRLPSAAWTVLVDTAENDLRGACPEGPSWLLQAHSFALLRSSDG